MQVNGMSTTGVAVVDDSRPVSYSAIYIDAAATNESTLCRP